MNRLLEHTIFGGLLILFVLSGSLSQFDSSISRSDGKFIIGSRLFILEDSLSGCSPSLTIPLVGWNSFNVSSKASSDSSSELSLYSTVSSVTLI